MDASHVTGGVPARARRAWPLFVVAVALVAIGIVLYVGRGAPPSLAEQVNQIGQGLKCPTCQALSVAQSDSPIAVSMRSEIRQQLQHGRSPDQIRSWFVARYGPQVLTDPSSHPIQLAFWIVPVAVLAVGIVAIVLLGRRRPPDDSRRPGVAVSGLTPMRLAAVAVVLAVSGSAVGLLAWHRDAPASAATSRPASTTPSMTAGDWVAVAESSEHQNDYAAAAHAYRTALRMLPHNSQLRTRLAFVLVRAGQPNAAIKVITPLADQAGPQQAEAVLVLGLAQRADDLPAYRQTLTRFLRMAGDNPAAPAVRKLLRGGQ